MSEEEILTAGETYSKTHIRLPEWLSIILVILPFAIAISTGITLKLYG